MKNACIYGSIVIGILGITYLLAQYKIKKTEKQKTLNEAQSPSYKALNSLIKEIED